MKSVAVYTSTRADYGLLKPLIDNLKVQKNLEVRLFVTGTHLQEHFGRTVSEIEKHHNDLIYYRVESSTEEDRNLRNLDVMSAHLLGYAQALGVSRPDLAVVLGDRYEALCFGIVCSALGVPLVHLHGGEVTTGALDDKFRHCLTKLSEWHMTASEVYRQRVIQLGEQPSHVFNTGALGVDNALNTELMKKEELEKELGLQIPGELFMLTFHPETNSPDYGMGLLNNFLEKFEKYISSSDSLTIVTGVNADAGSAAIRQRLLNFVESNPEKTLFVESLGVVRYLSLMRLSTAVLGNSSSGVLEASSMGAPAVNLGTRQNGRLRDDSVIDLLDSRAVDRFDLSVLSPLKRQLASEKGKSLFGDGRASEYIGSNILKIAANLPDPNPKLFYDLPK